MTARLNLRETTPAVATALKHLTSASNSLKDSSVPATTEELVKIRASQINTCGFCLDMHTKEAAAAGETDQRLHLVAAWREATVFTDAERAALELAEQGTRISESPSGITDEAWENAAKHYNENELAALVGMIAVINAFNRMSVMIQQPGGAYRPGRPA